MISWNNINSLPSLEDCINISYTNDVLIFKHSTTCSISLMAKLRLEDGWNLEEVQPFYLDVKSYRDISDQVAEKFHVRHESPQVLLLRNGECIYDASHFDITIDELQETLAWHAK